MKYDHESGSREVYEYPKGWYGNETPFAKSTRGGAEDRGYAVTLATHGKDYTLRSLDLRCAAHRQGPDRARRAAGPRADRLPCRVDSRATCCGRTTRAACVKYAHVDVAARASALVRSAHATARGLRAQGDPRRSRRARARATHRAVRRWNAMDLGRVSRARARAGGGAAGTRRACRRSRGRVAAERPGAGARLVCDQLSRRDLRTAEHGVPRRVARAHDQRVPRASSCSRTRRSSSASRACRCEHVERVIVSRHGRWHLDRRRDAKLDDSAQPQPWDAQSIIYTSGTTGLSKGVLSPYLQLYTTATVVYGYLREGEGILVNLPMFHVGGTSSLMIALIRSGSFHLVDGFSTDRFWDQVRRGNCATTSGLIGIMGAFLMKSPPRPDDREHPLRCMTGFPGQRADGAHPRPLRHRLSHRLQHDGAVGAARQRAEHERVRRVRQAAQRRRVPARRRARRRSAGRHARRADRTQRHAVDVQPRLRRPARRDRARLAQRLVPHRRHPAQGRRRQLLLRRSPEGRDPPPRRERVVARSRGGRAHASRPSTK